MIPNSLVEIVNLNRLTEIVDIGANPIDGEPPYRKMLASGLCNVTGFEPQVSALIELNNYKNKNERYLPYAISDGKNHTLTICRASGMTSLLTPDHSKLRLFEVLAPLGEVINHILIPTIRLDDISEIIEIDFLKIDIQGSELSVFRSGKDKLKSAVAILS